MFSLLQKKLTPFQNYYKQFFFSTFISHQSRYSFALSSLPLSSPLMASVHPRVAYGSHTHLQVPALRLFLLDQICSSPPLPSSQAPFRLLPQPLCSLPPTVVLLLDVNAPLRAGKCIPHAWQCFTSSLCLLFVLL